MPFQTGPTSIRGRDEALLELGLVVREGALGELLARAGRCELLEQDRHGDGQRVDPEDRGELEDLHDLRVAGPVLAGGGDMRAQPGSKRCVADA